MTKIFSNHIFNRVICLFFAAVFLSSLPTGATTLALCLDEDDNHIVGQNFYLSCCHSSAATGQLLFDQQCSALAEKKNNDCVDVSLTNANILSRPSKITLPSSSKVILSYALPHRLVGFQKQVAEYCSPALSKPLFVLPDIEAHRTVVLLI